MGVGGQRHAPATLLPGKKPGTHFIGGWVGLRPVCTGGENLDPQGSVPQSVQPVVGLYTD
jgi:hypothetical protein